MVVANVRRGRRSFTRMLDAAVVVVVFVIVVIHCGSAWITRDWCGGRETASVTDCTCAQDVETGNTKLHRCYN